MSISNLSYTDGAEALKDGRIRRERTRTARRLWKPSPPWPFVDDINIISMEPEILEQITTDLPYYSAATIPRRDLSGHR